MLQGKNKFVMEKKKRKRTGEIEVVRNVVTKNYICPAKNCDKEEKELTGLERHVKRCSKFLEQFTNDYTLICPNVQKRARNYANQHQKVRELKVRSLSKETTNSFLTTTDVESFCLDICKDKGFKTPENHFKDLYLAEVEKRKNAEESRDQFQIEIDAFKNDLQNPVIPPFDKFAIHVKYESKRLNRRNADQISTFVINIMNGRDLFKMYNSFVLQDSSKNDTFTYFCQSGVSFNKTFMYEPRSIKIVSDMLKTVDNFLGKQAAIFTHFDNNDNAVPFSLSHAKKKKDEPEVPKDPREVDEKDKKKQKYIPTTSFVHFTVDSTGINLTLVTRLQARPNTISNREIASKITKITNEEKLLLDNNIRQVFDWLSVEHTGHEEVMKYDGLKKRLRDDIKIAYEDYTDMEKVTNKFIQYMAKKRVIQTKSSLRPCKSTGDMEHHIQHVKNILPNAKIIYCGDLPVFREQRKKNPSILGKFHIKMNMSKGIWKVSYDNGPFEIQKKFMDKKKNISKLPHGYFKFSEMLLLNVFILCFSIYIAIFRAAHLQAYPNNVNAILNYQNFKGFRENLAAWAPYITATSGYTLEFMKDLDTYVFLMLMSYYIFLNSIKKNSFGLYVLAIKMFLRWCRATGNPKYFSGMCLHLIDMFYRWSTAMLELFKKNMTYTTSSSNRISYDEQGEICNLKSKSTTKNANSPGTKIVNRSEVMPLLGFTKALFAPKYDYRKEKIFEKAMEQRLNLTENAMAKVWKEKEHAHKEKLKEIKKMNPPKPISASTPRITRSRRKKNPPKPTPKQTPQTRGRKPKKKKPKKKKEKDSPNSNVPRILDFKPSERKKMEPDAILIACIAVVKNNPFKYG